MEPRAVRFVVLLGVVSLFADLTYEGARSATGPFLALLGASGAVVGLTAGLGEFVGYGVRVVSGALADRTRRYWMLTLSGYTLNLLAVPCLALAGRWEVAAGLVVAERLGKAIRTPPRDVLLSYAAARAGHGRVFGLHEALDQVGAVLGPLVVVAALRAGGSYPGAFAVLAVPAMLALGSLALARRLYPEPAAFEAASAPASQAPLPRPFWRYLGAVACLAAGYADYPLVAFHLKQAAVLGDGAIVALYALAMGVDALAALAFGRWFDRRGLRVLTAVPLLSCLFAPLAFSQAPALVVAGVLLWGVGMGAQESVVRAALSAMVPAPQRGRAFGLFHAAYGAAWFLGSAFMGWLYDRSLGSLVAFSVVSQLLALPWLLRLEAPALTRPPARA